MKKVKYLLLALLAFTLGVGLVSCGGGSKGGEKPTPKPVQPTKQTLLPGYSIFASNPDATNKPLVNDTYSVAGLQIPVKKVYNGAYASDMSEAKLNYLFNATQSNADIYADLVDGLVDNNKATQIVGSLALSTKVTENQDGTETHSYQIRKNVVWYRNVTGEPYKVDGKVQYVTPLDFVSSAFFTLKSKGAEAKGQYTNFIVGAEEFSKFALADENQKLTNKELKEKFDSMVKIKADMDNYTISYTIKYPISYFDSVLTYSPYLPVNQHFLDEVGESNFGQTIENVLCNGAFFIKSYTPAAKIVYLKNPNPYWDDSHVYLDQINLLYLGNNQEVSKTRVLYENGELDQFTVNKNDTEGWDKYVGKGNTSKNPKNPDATPIFNTQGGSTWFNLFNYNRTYFPEGYYKTDKQKQDTKAAFLNKEFRLGVVYGQNKLKAEAVNSSTPGDDIYRGFTTIGLATDTKGRDYTDYVLDLYRKATGNENARLDGASLNYDPKYSPEKSQAFFKQAKQELGDTVQYPIMIDVLDAYTPNSQREIHTLYQSLEQNSTVDGVQMIKVHYIPNSTPDQLVANINSYNYDINSTGWGADYADPYGFLTVFHKGDGFYLKYMGLDKSTLKTDAEKQEADRIYNLLFKSYNDKLVEANKLYKVSQTEERFKMLAQAEYDAIFNDALFDPFGNDYSWSAIVGRVVPYQAAKSKYGISTSRHKNVVIAKNTLSRNDKQKLIADLLRLQGVKSSNVSITLLQPDGNPLDENWVNYSLNISGAKDTYADLPQSINYSTNQIVVGWYKDAALTQKPDVNEGGRPIFSEGNATLYAKIAKMNRVKSIALTLNGDAVTNNQKVTQSFENILDSKTKFTFVETPTYENPQQDVTLTPEEQESAKEPFELRGYHIPRAFMPVQTLESKTTYDMSLPEVYKKLTYYGFATSFARAKTPLSDDKQNWELQYSVYRAWDSNNAPVFTVFLSVPVSSLPTYEVVAKNQLPLLKDLNSVTAEQLPEFKEQVETLTQAYQSHPEQLKDLYYNASVKLNQLLVPEAQKAVDAAQKALDDFKKLSPEEQKAYTAKNNKDEAALEKDLQDAQDQLAVSQFEEQNSVLYYTDVTAEHLQQYQSALDAFNKLSETQQKLLADVTDAANLQAQIFIAQHPVLLKDKVTSTDKEQLQQALDAFKALKDEKVVQALSDNFGITEKSISDQLATASAPAEQPATTETPAAKPAQ